MKKMQFYNSYKVYKELLFILFLCLQFFIIY